MSMSMYGCQCRRRSCLRNKPLKETFSCFIKAFLILLTTVQVHGVRCHYVTPIRSVRIKVNNKTYV